MLRSRLCRNAAILFVAVALVALPLVMAGPAAARGGPGGSGPGNPGQGNPGSPGRPGGPQFRNQMPPGHRKVMMGGNPYYFHGGHYYRPMRGGFVAVFPPVGLVINTLPPGFQVMMVAGVTYYVYDGIYYQTAPGGYVVVSQPAATAVTAPSGMVGPGPECHGFMRGHRRLAQRAQRAEHGLSCFAGGKRRRYSGPYGPYGDMALRAPAQRQHGLGGRAIHHPKYVAAGQRLAVERHLYHLGAILMKRFPILALMLMLVLAMGCGGPGKGKGGPPPDGQAPPQAKKNNKPKAPPKESTPQERLERRVQALVKVLELTPEQTVQVRDILSRAQAGKQALEPEGGRWDSPDAMSRYFLKMRQVDQRAEQELGKVLSEDQLEDYQDYLEDQRGRFGRKQSSGGGPKRPGGMTKPQGSRN